MNRQTACATQRPQLYPESNHAHFPCFVSRSNPGAWPTPRFAAGRLDPARGEPYLTARGRAITSLACVNRLFAQWPSPYRQPVARYRALDNAGNGTPQQALHLCMSALYDPADVTSAHRLELFLKVGTVLGNHFSAEEFEPRIDALLPGIQHLPRADKLDALLGLVQRYSSFRFYTTQPRYMKMASHIRSLPPSATQARLTEMLGSHISDGADGDADAYAKRAQVFLDTCAQWQPTHCAQALNHLLHFIILYPAEMSGL